MKKITDDDLTLLYYGEPDDPALAAKVAASPELNARYDALCAELGRIDLLAPPRRGDDYGADVWRKISPRLDQPESKAGGWKDFLSALGRPRFSLAGAFSLVAVAALAFLLGRQDAPPGDAVLPAPTPQTLAAAGDGAARLLTASVSGHLDELNLVLTEFANTPQTAAADAERYTDMLVANRIYRQAAVARGNQQLAAFLSEIEPLLIELAYEAHRDSPATRERMQREIRDGLLFRVRVMNRQLDEPGLST